MALGGGTWTSQDKVLPGSYINFVSADKAGITLSDRGVCAIPMELDWGKDGEVIKVNAEDVRNVSYRVFGHDIRMRRCCRSARYSGTQKRCISTG